MSMRWRAMWRTSSASWPVLWPKGVPACCIPALSGLVSVCGEVVVFADVYMDVPDYWWQPIVAALNCPNVDGVGPGSGAMGKLHCPVAYSQRIVEASLRVQ